MAGRNRSIGLGLTRSVGLWYTRSVGLRVLTRVVQHILVSACLPWHAGRSVGLCVCGRRPDAIGPGVWHAASDGGPRGPEVWHAASDGGPLGPEVWHAASGSGPLYVGSCITIHLVRCRLVHV